MHHRGRRNGSDLGPTEFIRGLLYATDELGLDCDFTLVGKGRLLERLMRVRKPSIDASKIQFTTQKWSHVGQTDPSATQEKRLFHGSSLELLRGGEADAVVSCGNTGALMAGVHFVCVR